MKNLSQAYSQPPKAANKFLTWALPDNIVEPVLGDLSEEYFQQVANNSLLKAKLWYWRQALKSGFQFVLKTQRGFVMFVFSILLFLVIAFMAMLLGDAFDFFFDIPSLLIVFPPAIAFAYAATSKADVSNAFSLLLGSNSEQNEQTYRSAKRVFSVLGNSGFVLGVFMTLIGWVAMGSNMEDMTHFGTAFAISILALIYGIALKMVCYVAEQKIQTLSELQS